MSSDWRGARATHAAVGLSFQDYMLDLFDGRAQHNLALTLGLTFR